MRCLSSLQDNSRKRGSLAIGSYLIDKPCRGGERIAANSGNALCSVLPIVLLPYPPSLVSSLIPLRRLLLCGLYRMKMSYVLIFT